MSRDGRQITENELLAHVDGALDEGRRAAVEDHLASYPAAAADVAEWQRQNETLRTLYGHVVRETVPEHLQAHRIARGLDAESASWKRLAAAIVLLAVGGAGGWFGRDLLAEAPPVETPLVAEAVTAHSLYASEVVHPVEVRADQRTHLATWLSRRLDRTLVVPDLRPDGFQLVGGRLLPSQDTPAAQFMYEDEAGRRVTLYIIPAQHGQESSLRYAALNNLESFFWTDEAISCALVGDLPREELRQIATLVYKQLG